MRRPVQTKGILWSGRAKDRLLEVISFQAQERAECWKAEGSMCSERTKAELQVGANAEPVEGPCTCHVGKRETRLNWLFSSQVWGTSKLMQCLCLRRKMTEISTTGCWVEEEHGHGVGALWWLWNRPFEGLLKAQGLSVRIKTTDEKQKWFKN